MKVHVLGIDLAKNVLRSWFSFRHDFISSPSRTVIGTALAYASDVLLGFSRCEAFFYDLNGNGYRPSRNDRLT